MGKLKILVLVLLLAGAACLVYYYHFYLPNHPSVHEFAYVLPTTASVLDSRAEIHLVVGVLKNGDRVEVLAREGDWAHVRLKSGLKGWIESEDLTDAKAFEEGRQLDKEVDELQAQAAGHTSFRVNLRLEPSRDAAVLAQLPQNKSLEVFGRRLVDRNSDMPDDGGETAADAKSSSSAQPPRPDVWYLVRTDSRAGWVYGRLVSLDIPSEISAYAESTNTVAWLVLNKVEDAGRMVPQYLVADRMESPDYDFDRIRVFTWWAEQGHYATSYVESRLEGFFPIKVSMEGSTPYFRLRLVDAKGRKFQKVYRLDNTIVRRAGEVEGWVSDAMPETRSRRPNRRR